MLLSMILHVAVSLATDYIFRNGVANLNYDFLNCFHRL